MSDGHLIDVSKAEAVVEEGSKRLLGLTKSVDRSSNAENRLAEELAFFQEDTLPKIRAFHREVDLGRNADPLFLQRMENPVHPRIFQSQFCIHPYLAQGVLPQEISLIQCPGISYEPALYFRFHAEHGSLVCVHGLRNGTQYTYGARQSNPEILASSAIASAVMSPVYLGTNMCFRSAPIYAPSRLSWDKLETFVRVHLEPLRKHGGFFGRTYDDWLHVFSLCHPSWLSKVEHSMGATIEG